MFKRKTADFLFFLLAAIPLVSLFQLYWGKTDIHTAFNVFLAYIGSKFDDDVVIMGLAQVHPKFLIILYLINYKIMDVLEIYYLAYLVLLAHLVNFFKFILPNQVSTSGMDLLKTPALVSSMVIWAYGTAEDEELFD